MATDALKSSNALYTGQTTGAIAPQQGLRRRHNFGDRVYKLTPDETPFFVYLNAVAKMPTNDPVFRVLEDREAIKWTDRTFVTNTAEAGVLKIEATEGENWTYDADGAGNTAASNDIPVVSSDGLLVGQLVQAIKVSSEMPEQITARVEAVGTNTVQLKTVSVSGSTDTDLSAGADLTFQVIGSAFAEGTGSPDSFGYGIDENFGYTQIFKTTASMSNTAYATNMRGYAKEWDRIWAMKLREHKVDIERAMLFNNKGIVGGIQYTDGLIGNILSQSGITHESNPADNLAYSAKKSYSRIIDIDSAGDASVPSEFTYDSFLNDLEVIFDPARGGSSEKFCMASLPVITLFNKMQGGFIESSVNTNYNLNINFEGKTGGFGHKVMQIETVHGTLNLVKQPLFRGVAKNMMVCVDLDNVKYRPLVGNGLNRDTYIDTNVQLPDEDLRKDLILTEAGLEVCMPESHSLFSFVNNGTPIG
tara:strand:+ start:1089 stop:2513 length:1425 start_codon:yes stop_codon:yes gene_type:complete